jgi:hypothetical protein
LKEACSPDSDLSKHSCRPGPTGAITFQQETSACQAPSRASTRTRTPSPSASSTTTASSSPRRRSPTAALRYVEAVDLLATHRAERVGVEGTASWGQHVAIALVAAGLDVREVPAQRSAPTTAYPC